jgi:GLPGLI family protein
MVNINPTYAQQKEQFKFNHKAIYEMVYLSDSLDQHSQKQQMTELLIGDGISLFRSAQKAYEDSLDMAYISNQVIIMSAPVVTLIGEINAFNYQVLKDFSSGRTKVYDEYTGASLGNLKEIAYYFEPQEAMSKWTLKNDTSTINGHLCQRAITEFGGRKWTAWFSLEISAYSDGPYKFRGLPGLIFRVHDEKKTWNFDLVELSKIDTLIDINFIDGLNFIETNKKQLYKDRRYYQKNQIEIREAAGAVFGENRVSIKNKLDEFIQQDNNWIELDF